MGEEVQELFREFVFLVRVVWVRHLEVRGTSLSWH